ncbi:hypothetical protein MGSAQ_002585 [marine sediment metagenome]|uniref:Uncharacterized protein n=1 Tax=marine sediment metagenome TaxID=412755 RepID=A0A1B6NR46_9ZZZZ
MLCTKFTDCQLAFCLLVNQFLCHCSRVRLFVAISKVSVSKIYGGYFTE